MLERADRLAFTRPHAWCMLQQELLVGNTLLTEPAFESIQAGPDRIRTAQFSLHDEPIEQSLHGQFVDVYLMGLQLDPPQAFPTDL